jgi:hypothetical protein
VGWKDRPLFASKVTSRPLTTTGPTNSHGFMQGTWATPVTGVTLTTTGPTESQGHTNSLGAHWFFGLKPQRNSCEE